MYCTVTDVKTYQGISAAEDDTLISNLIRRAQARIDAYCVRTFEASTNTSKKFDAVSDIDGLTLYLDADLCEIDTITNGDGITVTDYVTEPRRYTPYYAITLKASSGIVWDYTDDPEDAITVSGKWAYSEEAPDDIQHACIRLVSYYYKQKDAQVFDVTAIPGSGEIVIPKGLPADVKQILDNYRKLQ